MSVSGLSERHRFQARQTVLAGVKLLMSDPAALHYSQGPARWEGIDKHLTINQGHKPAYGDCSSTATWLLWNALHIGYGVRDVVNGTDWKAGYTGTMLNHGKNVVHSYSYKVGDLALYGTGAPGEHVAVYIGGGRVFSHGSERGPFLLPINYRSDLMCVRRYV